jgi:hypothetical protein
MFQPAKITKWFITEFTNAACMSSMNYHYFLHPVVYHD